MHFFGEGSRHVCVGICLRIVVDYEPLYLVPLIGSERLGCILLRCMSLPVRCLVSALRKNLGSDKFKNFFIEFTASNQNPKIWIERRE